MQQITITVEDQIQKAFEAADEQKKRELSYLVSAFLGDDWRELNLN
jgi:hypothetical protein